MTPTVSRQEIDELKAAVDLVALLRVHGVAVQKSGRGFRALCPFHEEKTPSLSVDPKKGVYHCFGCGQSGDSLTFLQSHAISVARQAPAFESRFYRGLSQLARDRLRPVAF